jgi:gliding motility-associated-like protein
MVNVMADNKFGTSCADSQRLSMLVLPANEVTAVFVPDVFTPNGDGTNDVFFVEMSKPLQFDMTILDANNRTVFRSNDYQATWSGTYMNTECKEDVYRVILSYKYSGDKDWKYIRKQIKLIRN